jgi:translation initiation factor 3 subunit I
MSAHPPCSHPHSITVTFFQVLLGGGQEAMSVTTTSLRQGKFETRFWHKVFEEEVGRVKGHFGPINTFVLFTSISCHIFTIY